MNSDTIVTFSRKPKFRTLQALDQHQQGED